LPVRNMNRDWLPSRIMLIAHEWSKPEAGQIVYKMFVW